MDLPPPATPFLLGYWLWDKSLEFPLDPKKTVIVVGAGASKEAKLPTSDELKKAIAKNLDFKHGHWGVDGGDPKIAEYLQVHPDYGQALAACRTICEALPQAMSIDNFIDTRKETTEIEFFGKLAIVRSILRAEKESLLYVDPPNTPNILDFRRVKNAWYNLFWQRVSENCQAQGLEERLSSVVFIVFNYDRCIEHFLCHSIQNYYGLSRSDAASLVNGMAIFHPYGIVGSLPWMGGQPQMVFGGEPETRDLGELAKQIKTFTEGTDPDASEVYAIRNHVRSADTLIFLGFAYHLQNLQLLECSASDESNRIFADSCFGTTYGISDYDLKIITSQVVELCGASLFPNTGMNLTCTELFRTYSRALSFV